MHALHPNVAWSAPPTYCQSHCPPGLSCELTTIKRAMALYAHAIRLPSCTVSLGPHAKLLAQETKAYTLLKPWDCILDLHITMVSVFRLLSFCNSLRRICMQDRLPLHFVYLSLVHLLVSRLELHKAYNMLVCTCSSGRFKENSTNEI